MVFCAKYLVGLPRKLDTKSILLVILINNMTMEQIESINSGEENIDPRIEEILTYYEPGIREDALRDWSEYSEPEKERLYLEFMKDHEHEEEAA